jgi:hypothetical protein
MPTARRRLKPSRGRVRLNEVMRHGDRLRFKRVTAVGLNA